MKIIVQFLLFVFVSSFSLCVAIDGCEYRLGVSQANQVDCGYYALVHSIVLGIQDGNQKIALDLMENYKKEDILALVNRLKQIIGRPGETVFAEEILDLFAQIKNRSDDQLNQLFKNIGINHTEQLPNLTIFEDVRAQLNGEWFSEEIITSIYSFRDKNESQIIILGPTQEDVSMGHWIAARIDNNEKPTVLALDSIKFGEQSQMKNDALSSLQMLRRLYAIASVPTLNILAQWGSLQRVLSTLEAKEWEMKDAMGNGQYAQAASVRRELVALAQKKEKNLEKIKIQIGLDASLSKREKKIIRQRIKFIDGKLRSLSISNPSKAVFFPCIDAIFNINILSEIKKQSNDGNGLSAYERFQDLRKKSASNAEFSIFSEKCQAIIDQFNGADKEKMRMQVEVYQIGNYYNELTDDFKELMKNDKHDLLVRIYGNLGKIEKSLNDNHLPVDLIKENISKLESKLLKMPINERLKRKPDVQLLEDKIENLEKAIESYK
ncbi:hypothetical protein JST56_03880 [Candidatus Dependentiae bacterium]|jgi:hypothetical protein|nr:hypothetical protein [Candidatus Dependentiae bacterium]